MRDASVRWRTGEWGCMNLQSRWVGVVRGNPEKKIPAGTRSRL